VQKLFEVFLLQFGDEKCVATRNKTNQTILLFSSYLGLSLGTPYSRPPKSLGPLGYPDSGPKSGLDW
jgi:hypothetical protein